MTAQLSRERIEQYANDPRMCNVNEEIRTMARMLLAGMDSEPLAYFYHGDETEWQGVALAEELDDEQKARCIPLYAAPPAPVAVPDELTREEYKRRFMEEDNFDDTYRGGWEACRAAMLKHQPSIASSAGAGGSLGIKQPSSNEPVTAWIKCSDRMPEDDSGVWVWSETGYGYAVEAYFDGEWYRTLTDEREYSITHWMPLPAAPEQEV